MVIMVTWGVEKDLKKNVASQKYVNEVEVWGNQQKSLEPHPQWEVGLGLGEGPAEGTGLPTNPLNGY